MSSGFKKTAAAIAMSAMVIAPIATAGLVLTTEAAFAKSEKDAEKSAGKNDRGKNARVLKNLNAANSWKQGQGYMNANPDSNIGIIKTYYDVRVLQTPFEMDLAAFLAFHNLDATAAVDDYVVACDNDQVCIDAEAEYESPLQWETVPWHSISSNLTGGMIQRGRRSRTSTPRSASKKIKFSPTGRPFEPPFLCLNLALACFSKTQ